LQGLGGDFQIHDLIHQFLSTPPHYIQLRVKSGKDSCTTQVQLSQMHKSRILEINK